MHRIDGPGAVQSLFTEGDPSVPQMATVVTAAWLNDIQENLARVVEAAGITLVKGDKEQLRQAINLLSGSGEVGEGKIWFSETLPASGDWLEADGGLLPVADYPALFAVYGYAFGGSGTRFAKPDLRGEFLRGWDHGAGNDPDVASRTNRGDSVTGDHVGTKQPSATLDHIHPLFSGGGNPGAGSAAGYASQAYNGVTQYTAGLLATAEGGQFMPAGIGSGFHPTQISRYETRPRNVTVLFLIRWR